MAHLSAICHSHQPLAISLASRPLRCADGLCATANRIALGLVLASLIIAAGVIMQMPTTIRLFGYPALAMVLFIIAATGGALAVQIVTHDRT